MTEIKNIIDSRIVSILSNKKHISQKQRDLQLEYDDLLTKLSVGRTDEEIRDINNFLTLREQMIFEELLSVLKVGLREGIRIGLTILA